MLDGRVQTIEGILRHAVVIDDVRQDGTIGLGSSVVVRDEFGDSRYTLVGPAEADIAGGLISLASPMGTALMGRRIGDNVSFKTPGGERRHERSRPQCQSDAGEPALRRKNPLRRIVPLAGGARQKALPHARRCAGIRRTKGKPERAPARPVHGGRDRRAQADSGLAG